jgi:hypothetical protein
MFKNKLNIKYKYNQNCLKFSSKIFLLCAMHVHHVLKFILNLFSLRLENSFPIFFHRKRIIDRHLN